ncbi:hypothetical protein IFHNHDMJ_03224 [Synechococcus sp. CBW1107]|nr:hypothetical protein IFHNHDMJ_03224 [Synechococcus sp. CBW1107]
MGATLPCPATPFDSPEPFRPWSARGIRRRDQLLGTLTAGFMQIPEDGGTIPVLGLYGEQDDGIKLETEVHMQAARQAASSRSRIVVSPEAPHGFHTRYPPQLAVGRGQRWLEADAGLVPGTWGSITGGGRETMENRSNGYPLKDWRPSRSYSRSHDNKLVVISERTACLTDKMNTTAIHPRTEEHGDHSHIWCITRPSSHRGTATALAPIPQIDSALPGTSRSIETPEAPAASIEKPPAVY